MKKSFFAFFYNNEIRAVLFQVLTLLVIAYFFYHIADNLLANIESRGIQSGFAFLSTEAGFDIPEHLIDYTPASSNLRVFYVGIINTLLVSAVGIIFATLIGFIVGISRLSNNWLVRKLAGGYVELFRNIPILLQILFWYNIVLQTLPHPRQSFNILDSIFINLRGIYFPQPIFEDGFFWVLFSFGIGIVLTLLMLRYLQIRQDKSGNIQHRFMLSIFLLIGLPTAIYYLIGTPMSFDIPILKGFNFQGGISFSPEFLALAFALSIYTATYIAEAIRSGIESVDKGQREAAEALGLSRMQALKLIILPQAMRVSIPPIINQYLNLTKNSSLAAAIGYSDIVSTFSGTVLNNVGQAIEIILMTMAVYLFISLIISLLLNIVNRQISIKE